MYHRGFPQAAVTLFSTRVRTGWTEHTTPREERAEALYSSAEVSISARQSRCCSRSVLGLRYEISIQQSPTTTSAPAEGFSTMSCCPVVSFCIFDVWSIDIVSSYSA